MSKKTLHIISLDIPYPPDRGSVIGIYNRIKALHRSGIDVILHAFYKKLLLPNEITAYCKTIYLIPRQKIWLPVDTKWPLYIQSRRSEDLVLNLLKDQHPILFEGLHTLFHFDDPRIAMRHKFVRMHNIESKYYAHLADINGNPLKKLYYNFESTKSDKIERTILPKADTVFSISEKEDNYLKSIHIKAKCIFPFVEDRVDILPGIGEYALYHGDLSIHENETAALFLINSVFENLKYPLYIAGKNPNKRLLDRVKNKSGVRLWQSPSLDTMKSLIQNAQIILAPFSQTTGYKMKLLESIKLGRHIIASANCKEYTEISTLLNLASSSKEWETKILTLSDQPLANEIILKRARILHDYFDPDKNIQKMIECIF